MSEVSQRAQVHTALLPAGWKRPKGYANGILAEGRQIYVAGQIGWDEQGRFVEGGFLPQLRRALQNVLAVLQAASAGPEHIVRMTWYVTDVETYRREQRGIGEIYREVIGRNFPAMTLIAVVALAEPEATVEIEATAVLPG